MPYSRTQHSVAEQHTETLQRSLNSIWDLLLKRAGEKVRGAADDGGRVLEKVKSLSRIEMYTCVYTRANVHTRTSSCMFSKSVADLSRKEVSVTNNVQKKILS